MVDLPAKVNVDGLVIVDKPTGWTSHDVVARIRRLAGTRRVGHAGTLDPLATGVLICGIGRATRLLGRVALADKAYEATIRLGAATTTDDSGGAVISRAATGGLADQTDRLEFELDRLRGEIDQRPSSVSAIKVNGRRAYELVRAGEHVELPARRVTVTELSVTAVRELTDQGESAIDLDVDVVCSTGTYVRAIARDLGEAMGVGGHLTALRRTRVGPYGIEQAATLTELELDFRLEPLAAVLRQLFPALEVSQVDAVAIGHGRRLAWPQGFDPAVTVALFGPDGAAIALAECKSDQLAPVLVWAG